MESDRQLLTRFRESLLVSDTMGKSKARMCFIGFRTIKLVKDRRNDSFLHLLLLPPPPPPPPSPHLHFPIITTTTCILNLTTHPISITNKTTSSTPLITSPHLRLVLLLHKHSCLLAAAMDLSPWKKVSGSVRYHLERAGLPEEQTIISGHGWASIRILSTRATRSTKSQRKTTTVEESCQPKLRRFHCSQSTVAPPPPLPAATTMISLTWKQLRIRRRSIAMEFIIPAETGLGRTAGLHLNWASTHMDIITDLWSLISST